MTSIKQIMPSPLPPLSSKLKGFYAAMPLADNADLIREHLRELGSASIATLNALNALADGTTNNIDGEQYIQLPESEWEQMQGEMEEAAEMLSRAYSNLSSELRIAVDISRYYEKKANQPLIAAKNIIQRAGLEFSAQLAIELATLVKEADHA